MKKIKFVVCEDGKENVVKVPIGDFVEILDDARDEKNKKDEELLPRYRTHFENMGRK